MNFNVEKSREWDDNDWGLFRDWLKGMLSQSTVSVTFTKKDGTERVMQCTLEPKKLPPIVESTSDKKPRKVSEDTLSVYDLEAKGWRSFTLKSVKRVNIIL